MNNEIRNCYFSSDENCCSHSREILVNLKDRYDLCTVEKQIECFKADILLENSNNKYKVLRLDLYGQWKESKHQECLLIKEGKNGEFYKIDHLYKKNNN